MKDETKGEEGEAGSPNPGSASVWTRVPRPPLARGAVPGPPPAVPAPHSPSHFTDEEIEAHRAQVACLRSHSL